jgi:uncharacterized membrane protein YgcG
VRTVPGHEVLVVVSAATVVEVVLVELVLVEVDVLDVVVPGTVVEVVEVVTRVVEVVDVVEVVEVAALAVLRRPLPACAGPAATISAESAAMTATRGRGGGGRRGGGGGGGGAGCGTISAPCGRGVATGLASCIGPGRGALETSRARWAGWPTRAVVTHGDRP